MGGVGDRVIGGLALQRIKAARRARKQCGPGAVAGKPARQALGMARRILPRAHQGFEATRQCVRGHESGDRSPLFSVCRRNASVWRWHWREQHSMLLGKNQRAVPAFVRIDKLAELARFGFVQPASPAAARTSAVRDQSEWRAPGCGVGGVATWPVLGAARLRLGCHAIPTLD